MPKDSTDSIHLVTRGHWTKWFLQLQHLCVSKGIWKDVKPTREKIAPLTPGSTPEDSKDFIRINPDYADDWLTKDPPHLIEISELIKRNDAINTEKYNRSLEHHKAHSKDDEGDEKMQLPPTPSPCTFQDISAEYSALQGEYRSKRDTYNLMHKSYQDVYQWITETVDSSHLMEITIENDNSTALPLRMIILKLHDKLAPTLTTAKSAVAQEYRNVLQQAVLGRSDPIKWHNDWTKAYTNAKAYHVEVDDDLALINFLQAVGTRMLPTWSSAMLIQIETNNQLGLPNYSLKQYGDIFGGLAYQDSLSPKGKGIFSTLSPSTNKPSNQAVKPHEFRSKEKNYRRHPDPYRCPCRAEADWKNNGSDSKHLAKDCEILQYVFTGKTGSLKTPNLSVKECNDIRHRAKDERWNSIRKIWGNKNWIPSSVATSSTNPIDPGARFNACLIQGQLGRGIYNTMESTPHPLTQCTIFDTGGAMHLVNDISLLDGQEYAPSPSSDYVESGTTRIPIIGRGTRTIKGITTRPDSEPNGDLILSNVAYIPGFHVNIVSETKLREAVIGIMGNTIFENWIKQEGIELELSPPNTHESNGGSERAGQEIITKQIKMRISAGLPDRLWVEAAQAATYLYNISPRKAYSSDHTIDIFTEQELQEYAQQLDIQERLDAEGTIIRDEYDVITSQSGMPAALSTPTMRTSDTPTHEQDSGSEEALDVENLSHNERFDHDHTKEAARSTPITQPTIIQEQIDSMDYETTGHATDVVRGEYVSDTENHPTNDSDSYSVEEVTSPPRLPNLTRTINQFKEDQLSLLPDQPLKRQRVMKIEIPKPTLDPSEYQIFDFNQDNPQTDYSPTHQHNTRRRLRLQEQAPKPSNKTLIGTLIATTQLRKEMTLS
ncbi:hypothetical protein H4I95_12230 [Botrytis cinerea]